MPSVGDFILPEAPIPKGLLYLVFVVVFICYFSTMSKKDEVHDRRSHDRHQKHHDRSASPPRKSSRRSPSRAMSGTRERDEDRRRSSKHERSRTRSESEGRQPLGRGAASSTSEENKVLLAISGLQKSVDSKLVDFD